jgi:hypothetical protein
MHVSASLSARITCSFTRKTVLTDHNTRASSLSHTRCVQPRTRGPAVEGCTLISSEFIPPRGEPCPVPVEALEVDRSPCEDRRVQDERKKLLSLLWLDGASEPGTVAVQG